jgi:hypothetical protein
MCFGLLRAGLKITATGEKPTPNPSREGSVKEHPPTEEDKVRITLFD